MKNFVKKYKYKLMFIAAAAVVIAVIFALFSVDGAANRKNIDFISSFGWQVEESPADISHLTIPEDLSGVFLVHSQLSAIDGSSTADYRGKNITRYSYKVLNHSKSDGGKIRADVFVYKSEIIAADISDISANGATAPISDISQISAPSAD